MPEGGGGWLASWGAGKAARARTLVSGYFHGRNAVVGRGGAAKARAPSARRSTSQAGSPRAEEASITGFSS